MNLLKPVSMNGIEEGEVLIRSKWSIRSRKWNRSPFLKSGKPRM